jgi:serine protease AprX
MKHKLLSALLFSALFIISDSIFAQKYWVMFKNKNGTPYSVSTPSAYLSAKAIARRTAHGVTIDNTDLPVTPSYVSQVDAVSGVTILFRSKWLNGVVISVTNTVALTTINSFTFVQTSKPVNRYQVSFPPVNTQETNPNGSGAKTQSPSSFNYGASLNQAQMLGVDCMHNLGFRGQGITIAVLDAGFTDVQNDNVFDSLFMENRLLGCRDFVDGFGDTTVFTEHFHGAMVLSTMAGNQPGTIIGTAPKASYWLLRTEEGSTETPSEEYNWLRGVEFADSVGADITTTSLGYTTFDNPVYDHTYAQLNGKTSLMSVAATMAARKGIIVLNAAGNEGCGSPSSCWYYIAVPADADSIITVGAVDPLGVKATFSSFGPTSDGRIKPDLCAQGAGAIVCTFGGGCGPGNGTSFATPILAGAVACFWQSKPSLKNMQIITGLKQYANNSLGPNNSIGWGIPNMCTTYYTTIGIKENDTKGNWSVYPNPFSGDLHLEFKDEAENVTIGLSDVIGRVIIQKQMSVKANNVTLNELSELKPGIYFITVNSAGQTVTKKIVKQ